MLSKKAGNRLDAFVSDYVVFDLETTGISPYTDKVIETSAVKVRVNKVADEAQKWKVRRVLGMLRISGM